MAVSKLVPTVLLLSVSARTCQTICDTSIFTQLLSCQCELQLTVLAQTFSCNYSRDLFHECNEELTIEVNTNEN